jgi:SAM-dependent methyltransferase
VLRPNPADQWERFGREDPYYGVYSVDEFRGRTLDADRRERFFDSGEQHVDAVLAEARRLFDPDYTPARILDFGCGVGRLLIPFARRASRVIGVDVSPSMLEEARRNCAAAGVQGVEAVEPRTLETLAPEFDLVHSALVLQHVPVAEGERIVAKLAGLLRPGGVGVIHLPIGGRRSLRLFNTVMKLPLAPNLLNVLRGRPWAYPHMQMNVYDLSRVMQILHVSGVGMVHVGLSARLGGYDPCTLYFQR